MQINWNPYDNYQNHETIKKMLLHVRLMEIMQTIKQLNVIIMQIIKTQRKSK